MAPHKGIIVEVPEWGEGVYTRHGPNGVILFDLTVKDGPASAVGRDVMLIIPHSVLVALVIERATAREDHAEGANG